ncbi:MULTISPECIES: beta-N-acetylglucosaminidase domain-containing protein [unclassified Streptomyces]|uniref:beta-N-acetylglucosaminidase domain-containing protein n=2 Tax=unclassified Streptomyces TaxID=2593676 RepID=UPI0001C1D02B|nr:MULTISPECIES: beta-N-acetylglucosaminidase domain-containing protein [unclassified Streptomyces]MYT65006.1 hyaluronidase [Streptomyces sp. SID8357]MYT88969.1 hyaluronidase [Streptomyces sp. SID8360]MYW37461.1 hyaluronidase [Streptomyces sp. SID1]AEN09981.1 Hyaluronidase [Streptomyces sp. SirexAA-E]PZX29809.1 hyaluronoglucosaminidase [Streptomyces sp. DvalAA-21]
MRLGRTRRATALAAAVIGGLLGPQAPAAPAAPDGPAAQSSTAPDRTGASRSPAVWPRPQSLRTTGRPLVLGAEATLLADAGADPYAVDELRDLLRGAGVRTVHEALPGGGPVFRLGGAGAAAALTALRAPARGGLPSGGYRLAVGETGGRPTVALEGVGEDGLFHGIQTLRQLVTDGSVARVVVRDWPGTAVRGTAEGFYGRPWSQEERLAQIAFMGRTKQNRYLYAAGDDPYRQARWREPYPRDQRTGFGAAAEKARAAHVTLGWAVSPGQTMCLASDADVRALTRKVDAMWALGVRVFQVQFQDVSYSEWHCDLDEETFGSGPEAAARAQARVANALAGHLAGRHPGSEPLSVMPTEYYQDGATDYRTALAAELDDRVQVAWTGVGVVPRTITGRELAGARDAFGHPLVTMDNYPVNDYAQDRIFLGPYTGREPAVADGSAALLVNAMEQPAASRIPLFTAADFAWNPRGYRPQESWRAAADDLAGGDADVRAALLALAGNSAGSVLGGEESAYLRPLLHAFWTSRAAANPASAGAPARELRKAFEVMRRAGRRLEGPADGRLDDEVRPWTEQLARYGRAGELALDLLGAQARGDGATAWKAQMALVPLRAEIGASGATVGAGVLDPFLDRVGEEADNWNGTDRDAGTVRRDTAGYTVRLGRARPVTAVTTLARPGATGADAVLEAHVPGQGWRRLGRLSPAGWTQTPVKGLRADALRVALPSARPVLVGPLAPGVTGPPPGAATTAVLALVPWFGDEPAADLDLARGETDAVIGGGAQRVEARLTGRRPAEVKGTLTAKAPKGVEVRVPKRTRVPRGARTEVPVDITVPEDTPAGEYEVPLSFGGERSTLTVRAFPRTAGPDLLRTARASSSADETPDFPAAAASDGDPETRWSSPVEDDAWWQAELSAPVRLGQVVLLWQDAYASRYRVQVSADGRAWRTAATVREGRGGRESVRTDARDTRFIRVQGDARATRYGYSLRSVEAYAVAE